jgi:hypothetical protein
MSGTAPLRLHEDLRAGDVLHLGGDVVATRSDHDGEASPAVLNRAQDVPDQWPAGKVMQHLGPRRAHPGSLAGCEHDRQGRGLVHRLIQFQDARLRAFSAKVDTPGTR